MEGKNGFAVKHSTVEGNKNTVAKQVNYVLINRSSAICCATFNNGTTWYSSERKGYGYITFIENKMDRHIEILVPITEVTVVPFVMEFHVQNKGL